MAGLNGPGCSIGAVMCALEEVRGTGIRLTFSPVDLQVKVTATPWHQHRIDLYVRSEKPTEIHSFRIYPGLKFL